MRRLIPLIVCMLLLFSIHALAFNIKSKTDDFTIDDDVPIWESGNFWRYNIGHLFFELNNSGQIISLDLTLNDLLVTVDGKTTTSYNMGLSGNIGGIFDFDSGDGTTLGGILFISKVSGSFKISQTNLSAEETNIVIRSIALLLEHPLMFNIPIPIPLTITINIVQDTPRPLIDFPLYDGKEGIIPETNLSTNIKLESILLKVLHSLIGIFPEEIYMEQNITLPMLMYTANEEVVSTPDGNYTAYNIEFFEGLLGSIFYAPLAGNYIKVTAEIDTPEISMEIKGELLETSYN